MAFLEGLQGGHEVVAAGYSRGDDALSDAGGNGAFDDGGDGIHGADNFGLELRGDVEFYLLEEVFGGAEAADDKDVLGGGDVSLVISERKNSESLPVVFCSGLVWR